MKTTKCNCCGKIFDVWDRQNNFRIQSNGTVGYGSEHDGSNLECNLCCSCFDYIMSHIMFKFDPFEEE